MKQQKLNFKDAFSISKPTTPLSRAYHPLKYLGEIASNDCRKNLTTIANMPYPADELVEPEFVGLTYFQVAVIKQAELAARHGSLTALEFLADRIMGKPAQVNLNVNTKESYEDFIRKVAQEEQKFIDVEAQELGI
jgi:hypothetical protein